MLEESISSTPTFWGTLFSWFTPTVFFLLLQLVIGTIFIISKLANTTHKQEDPQVHDFPHPQQQNHLVRSPSMLQRLKSINFYSYPYRSHDPQIQNPHFHNTPQFQTQTHEHEHKHPQLDRSPSVLQRLKSINLYSYFPTEPFTSKLTTDTNTTVSETHVPDKPHVREEPVVETDEENEEDDDYVVGDNNIIKQNYNFTPQEHHEEGSSLDEIYSQLQGQDGHFTRTQSDTKPSSGEVPTKLPRKMKKSASSKSAFSHFKEEDIVESLRPATVREAKVSGAAAVDDDEVDAKADDFINKFKQQLKLQRLDSIMRYKEMIGRGTAK
ncbi:pathogen-associated molecular patterns-induced protein A70 [Abrus precatorius]|uniref:Pathogen-associated molecular patterns-induced protein A70 n=1 Tax=Abrus precatorius TaxID=3816 RepID=A0A8B8JNG6_ABRPR|nr:pathogen-associated molecular patterns-induced protein A70 [Abrus precatorius]